MLKFKYFILKTSAQFTLTKLCGAVFTVTIIATIKYFISGSFHIEYCDFFNNVAIGLLGWTVNTSIIAWLTEYFNMKGINFSLYDLLYGMNTMKQGGSFTVVEPKPKLYNAMDLDEESDSDKNLDKGKGIDREAHPNYDSFGTKTGISSSDSLSDKSKGKEVAWTSEAPWVTWSRVFPGMDPSSIIPKRTNPGPGFNVPGGVVPIRDEICKHIDYNSHILNQFKKMDLETAIEQKNNYLNFVRILDNKIAYAQGIYAKIPTIPTTEYEFKLRNQIIRDLEGLNRDKERSEAKATLLTSRIQFIEIQINQNKD